MSTKQPINLAIITNARKLVGAAKDDITIVEDSFKVEDIGEKFPTELQELLHLLEDNATFHQSIDKMLQMVDDHGLGSKAIESELLVFLYKMLKKIKDAKGTHLKTLYKRKKQMQDRLQTLSLFLMMQSTQALQKIQQRVEQPKNHTRYLDQETLKNLKIILQRLAVYELYKVLNPKRIAGESKLDNFIHNAVLAGVKAALTMDPELEQEQGAEKLEKLEAKHKHFSRRPSITISIGMGR